MGLVDALVGRDGGLGTKDALGGTWVGDAEVEVAAGTYTCKVRAAKFDFGDADAETDGLMVSEEVRRTSGENS